MSRHLAGWLKGLIKIEYAKKGLKELGLFSSVVGHLGDGNFHEAIMYHRKDPIESAAVDKHVREVIERALEMEGTSTVGSVCPGFDPFS